MTKAQHAVPDGRGQKWLLHAKQKGRQLARNLPSLFNRICDRSPCSAVLGWHTPAFKTISQDLCSLPRLDCYQFPELSAMDQQAPRTPFSPARSNFNVSHRPGGPASAAKSKKPKQQV